MEYQLKDLHPKGFDAKKEMQGDTARWNVVGMNLF